MRLLVSSCVVAIALCLVILPSVYRLGYDQAAFENRTIACWPTKDDPTPVRHP
jgi:hypothetical protein